MLIPRGGGRGTIPSGLSSLVGPGNGPFPGTPTDVAQDLARKTPVAQDWPGRTVAIALQSGLSAIPLKLSGEVTAHG